jgi:hypothetical protein
MKKFVFALISLGSFMIGENASSRPVPTDLLGPVQHGVLETLGIKFAYCDSEHAGSSPEICSHPIDGSWDAQRGQNHTFWVGPPVNQEALRTAGYWQRKKLTCTYCRAGNSNGPLRGTGRATNVVPVNASFVVTGAILGPGGPCYNAWPMAEGLCTPRDIIFGRPSYTPEQCIAACTQAWQQQVVRFTCEYSGFSNFDGDPQCETALGN